MPNRGDLKVWWIPQVGMEGKFEVPVSSVVEGVKIMTVLADYDLFQFEKNVKPDYANTGGMLMWDDEEWVDWYDDASGYDNPREWLEDLHGL